MNTVLICLIICTVYFFVMYRILIYRLNKKVDNRAFLKSVKEEINSLITQINETTDRNVLLIENRLERLSSAISEADRKLLEIRDEKLRDVKPPVKETQVKSKEKPICLELVEDETQEPQIKNEQVIEDNNTLPKRERIILLHKQGISPTVIASQTKATIGEVELIISLNRG